MNRAKLEKRQANEEYALRFPRRDRRARKRASQARVRQRDETWLRVMGIPIDPSRPLVASGARR